jgi:hypothetical protein
LTGWKNRSVGAVGPAKTKGENGMKQMTADLLVIGGGPRGRGWRGMRRCAGCVWCWLKGADLTHGTTGRYHGLLHSGGRYAVKDPAECARMYRGKPNFAPHPHPLYRRYQRLFVVTPEDEGDYPARFQAACPRSASPAQRCRSGKPFAASRCSTRASAVFSRCPTGQRTVFWPPTPLPRQRARLAPRFWSTTKWWRC